MDDEPGLEIASLYFRDDLVEGNDRGLNLRGEELQREAAVVSSPGMAMRTCLISSSVNACLATIIGP